jgi:hypothetical protein
MRRGRFFTAVGVVAGFLLFVGTGVAADSQAIYQDLADGHASRHYSQADLKAAAKDAMVEGYGGVAAQTARPAVAAQALTANRSRAAGNSLTQTNTASASTLPFTGVQLGVFAALGLALLGGGLLLRRAARD